MSGPGHATSRFVTNSVTLLLTLLLAYYSPTTHLPHLQLDRLLLTMALLTMVLLTIPGAHLRHDRRGRHLLLRLRRPGKWLVRQ